MIAFHNVNLQEKKLIKSVETFSFKNDVLSAVKFIKEKHKGITRAEGTPYILHLFRSTLTLIEKVKCKDRNMIIAMLCHDVIEDTPTTKKELEKKFGKKVLKMVWAISLHKGETKEDLFDRIMTESKKVRTLKCCDWLDNSRSMKYIPDPKFFEENLKLLIEKGMPLAKITNQFFVTELEKVLTVGLDPAQS